MRSEFYFAVVVGVGGVAIWLTGLVNMFIALANRRPGVSLWQSPLYRPSLLTQRGVNALVRYYTAGVAFVVWLILAVLIHWLLFS